MNAPARRCSECGDPIADPRAKTCSSSCRSKRSRRIRAAEKKAKELAAATRLGGDEAEVYDAEKHDIARDIMAKELAPIVREQITDEVIGAVGDLLKLTPKLVQVLERDLEAESDSTRMKAAGIVAKYTLGQTALMPKEETQDAQLVVNLGQMPTPGSDNSGVFETEAIDIGERVCEECGHAKLETDFEGEANRCRECQDKLRSAVLAKFSGKG